jgi:hypothetical protein
MTLKTLHLSQAFQSLDLPGLERNLFSSREWLEVIQRAYGVKLFVKFLEDKDGGIGSYLIYSVVKNFLEWKICVCSYCDYFDAYVQSREDWLLLFEDLRREYPHFRIAVRQLQDPYVPQIPELHAMNHEKFHILDVRDDLDTIWRRTHDSFRSAVKQAQRGDLRVERCGKSALKEFYRLHLCLRKNKYRLFAQPYRLFANIWEAYMEKDNGVLLGAYNEKGEMVGGNIYLVCGNTLYYKFNTSRLDSLKLRPNNLLFWEGIRYAKERNLEYVDLGSSGCHQSGLILYKNHTGAKMMEITHYGYTPEDYRFSQKIILNIFTRMMTAPGVPMWMTRLGAHLIYPFLA